MRLFSALVPPDDVLASLRAELAGRTTTGALRWSTPEQWHVTLGFYGPDDEASRTAWLRERLRRAPAPSLRLAGSGTFRGVVWLGVSGTGVTELAARVRSEEDADRFREFRGHLTVARGSEAAALAGCRRELSGYVSPRWTAREAVLLRSDPGGSPGRGPVYRVVARFPLGDAGGDGAC